MTSLNKNRLQTYETGWLTLLVEMGVATTKGAHDAMCRVAARLSMRPMGSEGDVGTRGRARGPGGSNRPPARTPPSTGVTARLIYRIFLTTSHYRPLYRSA
jgi:hypothetical protein